MSGLPSQKGMLVNVKVRNFLSLRDVDVSLGKVNVFIGPNASGKSNFARAIQLVANHARIGAPSLQEYEGFKGIAYGFDPYIDVTIILELLLGNDRVRYELTLTQNDYEERAYINNELALESKGRQEYAKVLSKGKEGYRLMSVPKIYDSFLSKSSFYDVSHKTLLTNPPAGTVEGVIKLSSFLRSITVHSFNPEVIRAYSDVRAQPVLDYRGGNLARVILHLYLEERKTFSMVEDTLRAFIPEVEEVIPHLDGDRVELRLRVKGLSEPLRPANISDGTLRILAFITALYSGTSLAVFEEPENCIHPHLLESLIDLIRRAPCQVVITTHSPYLLDHVEPEEVFVVEKVGTETVIKRLTDMKELKAVRKWLEEGGTLGEAWYSGLVGGVPRAKS